MTCFVYLAISLARVETPGCLYAVRNSTVCWEVGEVWWERSQWVNNATGIVGLPPSTCCSWLQQQLGSCEIQYLSVIVHSLVCLFWKYAFLLCFPLWGLWSLHHFFLPTGTSPWWLVCQQLVSHDTTVPKISILIQTKSPHILTKQMMNLWIYTCFPVLHFIEGRFDLSIIQFMFQVYLLPLAHTHSTPTQCTSPYIHVCVRACVWGCVLMTRLS
jgi:hypothetical protein